MRRYFGVNIEFDHNQLEQRVIELSSSVPGYCCFIDLNSLSVSYKDTEFRRVLNEASVNSCDGSYIALFAGIIYKNKFRAYIGPDFFSKFIFVEGRHVIIGSTEGVYQKILDKIRTVKANNFKEEDYTYIELPFMDVSRFDYFSIAKTVNNFDANYVWVSLGAPKQEFFMNRLTPQLNKGAVLGVGAAFNYFTNEVRDIPVWAKRLRLIWLYRIFTEPKKQLRRFRLILLTFPKIVWSEMRFVNK